MVELNGSSLAESHQCKPRTNIHQNVSTTGGIAFNDALLVAAQDNIGRCWSYYEPLILLLLISTSASLIN